MRYVRCDGPGCGNEHTGTYPPTWPTVEADEDADHGQFCSWTCLAAWATNRAIEREGQLTTSPTDTTETTR